MFYKQIYLLFFLLVLYSKFSLVISFIHSSVCVCQFQTPNLSFPLSPLGFHTFVFYICVSIPASKIGSSVLLAVFFTYNLLIQHIIIRLIFPNHSSGCQDDDYSQPLPWTEFASSLKK